MIQSSVRPAARARGQAEGGTKSIRAEQKLCLELIKLHHPKLLSRAKDVVVACSDHAVLRKWTLNASPLDDAGFARLLGLD